MSLKYNYEKVVQYIYGLEKQINQVRAFGKKLAKTYESSNEDINKIVVQKNGILHKAKDKDFKKDLNNLDYIILEKHQNDANILWLQNHVENWLQVNKQVTKQLLEQAKKLQSKRLNKTLKDEEIANFKTILTNKAAQFKNSIGDIIRTISQWHIKNCCGLIQNLTTTMQKIKTNEKKKHEGSKISKANK